MGVATATLLALACCSTPTAGQPAEQSSAAGGALATASGGTLVTPSLVTTPSPTPTYVGSRTLTESDFQATVVLSVGQSVEVRLPADYDPPTSSRSAVARALSRGGYPTGQPVQATFRAEHAGRADLTSETDYGCLHTTPRCELPQRIWIVHVVVE